MRKSITEKTGSLRQNICSNISCLKQLFENDDKFKDVNKEFKKRYDVSIVYVLNEMHNDLSDIGRKMASFDMSLKQTKE